MMQFYLPELLQTSRELGRLREYYKSKKNAVLSEKSRENNKKAFLSDVETFDSLDLKMCSMMAQKIADNIGKPMSELADMLDQLYQRMTDECSLRKFVALSVKDAAYIFPTAPLFGIEVDQAFAVESQRGLHSNDMSGTRWVSKHREGWDG